MRLSFCGREQTEESPLHVAVWPGLTTCFAFEDARELLSDAIETWVLSAVKDGETLPVVDGCRLAVMEPPGEPEGGFG